MKLQNKITLAILCSTTLVNLLFSSYFLEKQRTGRERKLTEKIAYTNRLLQTTNDRLIWNLYMEQIRINAQAFFDDPEIVKIEIRDHRNIQFVNLEKENSFPGLEIEKNLDMVSDNAVIARMKVVYTRALIEMELKEMKGHILVFSLLLQVLVIIIVYTVTIINLSSIPKILAAITEVSRGNYDFRLRMKQKNEFKQIEHYFNEMAASIKKSNRASLSHIFPARTGYAATNYVTA